MREVPIFAELSGEVLSALELNASRLELSPGERLPETHSDDFFYVVMEGKVAAVLDYGDAETITQNWDYLTFFERHDFFSDGFHQHRNGTDYPRVDCIAQTSTQLTRFPIAVIQELVAESPRLEETLSFGMSWGRSRYVKSLEPARHLVQDFHFRHQVAQATTLRVLQLDRCISCGACDTACSERHNSGSHISLEGPRLGRLAFPNACWTCVDPACLASCGFGAIDRATNGEVKILDNCVGCGNCQRECPHGAIQLRSRAYRSSDFPRPVPDVDAGGESNVRGLYVIGEAVGDNLIKLAINHGQAAVEDIAEDLAVTRGVARKGCRDVIIVGAGPAGLSAALACKENDLSFGIFEKGDVASTIRKYPKNKLVMAEPAHLPLYGALWLEEANKEELLEVWEEIIETMGLKIREHEPVTLVRALADGTFGIETPKGRYRARRVIMATGVRSSPRRLDVPGATDDRVFYHLENAKKFARQKILVVGGGDSAVETAVRLSEAGCKVTLSHRRPELSRVNYRNRGRLRELERAGRIRILAESRVMDLGDGVVGLRTPEGERRIGNHFVFAMLGADPPLALFRSAGIDVIEPGSPEMDEFATSRGTRMLASKCEHCTGFGEQACVAACPTGALMELKPEDVFGGAREGHLFDEAPFVSGMEDRRPERELHRWVTASIGLALSITVAIGIEAFLRLLKPHWSLQAHLYGVTEPITSGQGAGHALGYIGALSMLVAAMYPLYSRKGWGTRLAPKSVWMSLHVCTGSIGPLLVTYHTTLKLDRWPSIGFWLMWAVVLTGLLGRVAAGWLKESVGLIELESQSLDAERRRLFHAWEGTKGRTGIFQMADAPPQVSNYGPLLMPVSLMWQLFVLRIQYSKAALLFQRDFGGGRLSQETADLFHRQARVQLRRQFLEGAERSVTLWRAVHRWLSVALFMAASAHVVVAMLFRNMT